MRKTPEQAASELAAHLKASAAAATPFVPEDGQHVLHAGTGLIGRFHGGAGGGSLEADQGLSVDVRVADLLPVTEALEGVTRFWTAEIVFENDGETFGTHEGIRFAARTEAEARLIARHAATFSAYDDDRVQDRSCAVSVDECEDMVADVGTDEESRLAAAAPGP